MAFSLDFLQAVSDWQLDRDDGKKDERAALLKELSAEIDPSFRQCEATVYRRVSLGKKPIWNLIAEDKLQEATSSWTLSAEIAKNFKGGVPGQGWQGVIFTVKPPIESIILNIDSLYKSEDFKYALERNKQFINGYDSGAGYYAGSECEVVLEIESLDKMKVQALGGCSSSKDELIHEMFGDTPSQAEKKWFDENLTKSGFKLGPRWLEGEPLQTVLNKMKPHIDRLKKIKNTQHGSPQQSE